ncbi:MAG: protein dehydratase, partial [Acidimicrobiaceae bacterium]|nr:protein dehydratase [Acidimicrobiaceae bacterium]
MEEIAFDDIDALNANVGEEWSDWGPEFELSQEKINAFADLTGDHQWIHIDEEKAKAG